MKIQVVYHLAFKQIMSIVVGRGRQHDLSLARQTIRDLSRYHYVVADLAYKGLEGLNGCVLTPIKKLKKRKLPTFAKQINREISRRRIVIEHINRQLKCFRSLSERYRNRRRRFGLRANLIAGIVNWLNIN